MSDLLKSLGNDPFVNVHGPSHAVLEGPWGSLEEMALNIEWKPGFKAIGFSLVNGRQLFLIENTEKHFLALYHMKEGDADAEFIAAVNPHDLEKIMPIFSVCFTNALEEAGRESEPSSQEEPGATIDPAHLAWDRPEIESWVRPFLVKGWRLAAGYSWLSHQNNSERYHHGVLLFRDNRWQRG